MNDLAPQPILIRVIDFETTGLGDDAVVVEAGYTDLAPHGGGEWSVGLWDASLFNPGVPIPPEASAVHHIRDADVADAPPHSTAGRFLTSPRVTHWAAHNAAYDKRFFGGGDLPWIDTLRLAYKAFPRATSHGNQALRYMLELDDGPDFDRTLTEPTHRAGPDTYVTAHLLKFMLESGMTVERAVQISAEMPILPRIRFGQHQGKQFEDVPLSYLEWMDRQRDMDPEALHTARHWMKIKRERGEKS